MAMIQELDKALHEGKHIYIFPRGNSFSGEKNKLIRVLVKKVNKVNVTLESDLRTHKVSRTGSGEANYNYDFYQSVDDFKAYRLRRVLADKLSSSNLAVTTDQILRIAEILEVDLDISDCII